MNNPWNTKMRMKFDKEHSKELLKFYCRMVSKGNLSLEKKLIDEKIPNDAKIYLKGKYEEGYGLKVLAREIGISYTNIRTLFKYLKLEHRKGRNIVTSKTKKFRSDRVKGNKNPWSDWPETHPEMHKKCSRGIQGYHRRKNGEFVYLRSTWEYIMAKWLDKNDIDWKYEQELFNLSNGEGYRPDFFIYKNDNLKMIIEVKGYYKDRVHKISILRNDHPELKVVQISNINDYTSLTYEKEKVLWKEEKLSGKELKELRL